MVIQNNPEFTHSNFGIFSSDMTNMMPDMLVPDLHQFTCMAEEETHSKIITNDQPINFLQSFFILFGDFATHHLAKTYAILPQTNWLFSTNKINSSPPKFCK